jgi:hypothetical protein
MLVQLQDSTINSTAKLLTLKFLLYALLVNPLEIAKKAYKGIEINTIEATTGDGREVSVAITNNDSSKKYDYLVSYVYNLSSDFISEIYFPEQVRDLDGANTMKFQDKIDIMRNSCAHADIWVDLQNNIYFKDTNPVTGAVRILSLSDEASRTSWEKVVSILDQFKEFFEACEF